MTTTAQHSTANTSPRAAAGRGGVEEPTTIPAVRLTNLHKQFAGPHGTTVDAVRGIDLVIGQGEVVAILGPNGAGKTTTIDMLLGLSQPTTGDVRVFGMSPREAVSHGLTAAVMQTGGLLPDITVRETVQLTASLFAHSSPVDQAMARAGIADIAGRQVKKCSGGQQQRLRFAMALVSDPALLVLDEPTTGMDVTGRRSFWEAIHADAEAGRTVLFATHYLEEADDFADRIVLVRDGRVVADGTSAQIRSMVSGFTLRASLRDPGTADEVRTLATRAGADGVEVLGSTLTLMAADSDAVALALLQSGLVANLEVTSRGLEDAFVALTGEPGPATA